MTKEALKLALEALDAYDYGAARIIIHEALAQPVQEPVECLDCGLNNVGFPATYDSLVDSVKAQPEQITGNILMDSYKAMQSMKVEGPRHVVCQCDKCKAQPIQPEPVAYLCENAVGHKYFRWKKPSSTYKPIALYTTPPQRTWVGLTDDELHEICNSYYYTDKELLKLIEQALKDKNHG